MPRFEKYVRRNPIDYGEKIYYKESFLGPNVWYRGNVDFGNEFTMAFIRVSEDMELEWLPHQHDYDIYLWVFPYDPEDMEDLGCEVEMCYGSGADQEKYVITKSGCFFAPAGVTHAPLTFRHVSKPLLFVYAIKTGDYHRSKIFVEPQ